MSTTANNSTQAAPATQAAEQIQPRKCGSCGAAIPADFTEGQGHALPCGH